MMTSEMFGGRLAACVRLSISKHRLGLLAGAALLMLATPTFAQRATDDAVASAQDAFGTVVGNETIGLYSAGSARGFSPTTAGNIRLEGLYVKRQGPAFSNRLVSGSSIRVGISAQSYPFVAPTGVADYNLRIPGEKPILSVVGKVGPYGGAGAEVDGQYPIISDKLSLGGGFSYTKIKSKVSEGNYPLWSGAVIARWHATDAIEVIPFFSREGEPDRETKPRVFLSGPYYDIPIDRDVFWGQDWSDSSRKTNNYGLIARGSWDEWRVQFGAFRSVNNRTDFNVMLLRNVQPNGVGQRTFNSFLPTVTAASSGELRVSRTFAEGDRRHTLHMSLRGRDTERDFGGVGIASGGFVTIGVPAPIPKPAFTYSPMGRDSVSEVNMGVSYTALWRNIGEMSIGVQRASYKRTLLNPAAPDARAKDSPWLYNGTLTGYLTDRLALYGSYTRGLEDGATAPDRASNPGTTAPATITEQIDFGARYSLTPNFRIIAGVFRVQKPQYDIDSADFFTRVGEIRHDGIELSASGEVAKGLRVVAGVVLLRARLSGVLIDQGIVGAIPPDIDPRTVKLNVQYAPPVWPKFSFDAQLNHITDKFTDATNSFKVPALTTVDIGARYRFAVYDSPATLRLQVTNVTDVNKWELSFGRSQYPTLPRAYLAQLAVDF